MSIETLHHLRSNMKRMIKELFFVQLLVAVLSGAVFLVGVSLIHAPVSTVFVAVAFALGALTGARRRSLVRHWRHRFAEATEAFHIRSGTPAE